MVNEDLLKYVEIEIKKGTPKEVVQSNLIANGWAISDVVEAFSIIIKPAITFPPTPQPFVNPAVENTTQPIISNQNLQSLSTQPIEPKKSSVKVLIFTMIIVLFILATGALAYYKFLAPELSPTEIIKNGMQASLNIKSFSFSATSTVSLENKFDNNAVSSTTNLAILAAKGYGYAIPSSTNINMVSTADGSIDFNSIENLIFNINSDTSVGANMGTSSSGSLSLGTSVIFLNKNLYHNLKRFNVSYSSSDNATSTTQIQMFLGIADSFASTLENKWIQIDLTNTLASSSIKNIPDQDDFSAIKDYLYRMSYVKAINNIGKETINDIPTYHLKVTVQHGQELIDLFKKFALKYQTSSSSDVSNINDNLQKNILSQKNDIDIWIGQKDYLIYKIKSNNININDVQTKTNATTSSEIVFNNYNQPMSITAPTNSTSLQEILQKLFGGMMGTASTTLDIPTSDIKI